MSLAQRERQALVESMAAVGPDAPTLCGEWTVRDLAAHLVVRERRPDSSPGILIKPLAGYTERVRRGATVRPWGELLEQIRTGPPIWSPLRPVDAFANSSEMFIHHEDVRRARPDWSPRALTPADEAQLWSSLRRIAKMMDRKSPVSVVLKTPAGDRVEVRRPGDRHVILRGPASELLLHAFGRDAVRIEMVGDTADVDAVQAADRSV
jgi:uncharacterized protein (TIGR03085 family)